MTLNNNFKGLFITGTDTAVGKTYVTQRILEQLTSQSISCVGMKPVASGAVKTSDGLRNDDALKLQHASSIAAPYELINPYCFEPAIAPHLAAQQAGVVINASVIFDAFKKLSLLADVVIVEGVGGWFVPLNTEAGQSLTVATLAMQLHLPIVLVVGLRIGCLNHALLTHYTIYRQQCEMAGWIANDIDNELLFAQQQIDLLQDQISAPLLAHLPWTEKNIQSKNNVNKLNVIDLDHLLTNS